MFSQKDSNSSPRFSPWWGASAFTNSFLLLNFLCRYEWVNYSPKSTKKKFIVIERCLFSQLIPPLYLNAFSAILLDPKGVMKLSEQKHPVLFEMFMSSCMAFNCWSCSIQVSCRPCVKSTSTHRTLGYARMSSMNEMTCLERWLMPNF